MKTPNAKQTLKSFAMNPAVPSMDGGNVDKVPDERLAKTSFDVEAPEECSDAIKPKGWFRWSLLLVCCVTGVAIDYAYDVPGATFTVGEVYFSPGELGMSYEQFSSWMYTSMSILNVILIPFSGALLNKLGFERMFCLSALFAALAQSCVSLGIQFKLTYVTLVGRAFTGVGIELLFVTVAALLGKWMGDRVGFGFGMFNVFARIGTISNNVASLEIASSIGLSYAYWTSALMLFFAFSLTLVLYMSFRSRRSCEPEDVGSSSSSTEGNCCSRYLQSVRVYKLSYWALNFQFAFLSIIMFGLNMVASPLLTAVNCDGDCCPDGVSTCAAATAATQKASFQMSLPFICLIILQPLCGFVYDHLNLKGRLLMLHLGSSFLVTGLALLSFATYSVSVYISLVLLGVSYALLVTAIMPLVDQVTKKDDSATAYALLYSLQALMLALSPVIVAELDSSNSSWHSVTVYFFVVGAIVFILSLAILFLLRPRRELNTVDESLSDSSQHV